jgi:hypothetical protein
VIVAALTSLGSDTTLAGMDRYDSGTTDREVWSESTSSENEVPGKE